MKVIALFVAVFLTVSAHSQSLLDALYSGKLKADTGTVLRKGDSLRIRENMAQKLVADSLRKDSIAAATAAAAQARQNAIAATTDSAGNTTNPVTTAAGDTGSAAAAAVSPTDPTGANAPEAKAVPKDNNRIWKTFMDSLSTLVKTEVLPSGKVKKGAYSVLINYEIKPDGQVGINSVASDPQSSFLEEQIKLRLTLDAPQLNPVLGTNGQPRTVARKQMLSFVK